MKHVSIAALALALALGGVAATPAMAKDKAPAAEQHKPSEAIVKAAAVAEPAAKAKDWAKLKDAALPLVGQVQNDDDRLFVGNWLLQAGQGGVEA